MLLKEGIDRLERGQLDEASKIFNAGLKFEPENPQLHYLNALVYHLQYLRGNLGARELADVGYRMALRFEPGHAQATLMHARLMFSSRNYAEARDLFIRAHDIAPSDPLALQGVAAASYYLGDMPSALWGAETYRQMNPDSRQATKASAMVFAAIGNNNKARSLWESQAEPVADYDDATEERLRDWEAFHRRKAIKPPTVMAQAPSPADSSSPGAPNTPTNAPSGPTAESPGGPPPSTSPVSPPPAIQSGPGGLSGGPPTPSSSFGGPPPSFGGFGPPGNAKTPVAGKWFECDPTPGLQSSASSGGGGGSTVDETIQLPALPSPCQGVPPPGMVVIDAVIMSTQDTRSLSHGINLLDGLAVVFTAARNTTRTINNGVSSLTKTHTNNTTIGALPSPAGIGYSLNIANSTDARNEVIARPSLLALDRVPSVYFSGAVVTLGITGTGGAASTIADRPFGVSLSVTPTLLDKDSMMLSVKAARSFIDVNSSTGTGAFTQQLQASRNSVTSNVRVRYGETLVLSGLSEREIQYASSGVPILQDIPGLQYLFKDQGSQNFSRSVLFLITPRRPYSTENISPQTPGELSRHNNYSPVDEFMNRLREHLPNLDAMLLNMQDNRFYLQMRDGDLQIEDFTRPDGFRRLMQHLKSMFYF